jgi:hypothetical protein
MSYRIGGWTLLYFLAGMGSLAAGEGSTPADIAVLHNIRYREGPSKQWVLDLAMKKDLSGTPRPGIVVIHGGGWIEGDKSSFAARAHGIPGNIVDFAALGFDHGVDQAGCRIDRVQRAVPRVQKQDLAGCHARRVGQGQPADNDSSAENFVQAACRRLRPLCGQHGAVAEGSWSNEAAQRSLRSR